MMSAISTTLLDMNNLLTRVKNQVLTSDALKNKAALLGEKATSEDGSDVSVISNAQGEIGLIVRASAKEVPANE